MNGGFIAGLNSLIMIEKAADHPRTKNGRDLPHCVVTYDRNVGARYQSCRTTRGSLNG